jgi:hypothetical protein
LTSVSEMGETKPTGRGWDILSASIETENQVKTINIALC